MYILKRLMSVIPVLFVVSVVVFLIIHLTPGDPASIILGEDASIEQIEQLREELNLNEPLYKQYIVWVFELFKGNLGESYFMHVPISELLITHLMPTLSLTLMAGILSIVIGVLIGVTAAKRQGTFGDQIVMSFSHLGMAIPNFVLGLLLLSFIGVSLQWLPVAGYEPLSNGIWLHLKHLILPTIALSVIQTSLIARMTRSSMIEVLNSDYIKSATAKGVIERNIVYKHALRNAFLPILTVIGQSIGSLIAGAIVIETIFNIPGIGQLVINSVDNRDYIVIQSVVLFVTLSYVFINLIIDILYVYLDPRVRLDNN